MHELLSNLSILSVWCLDCGLICVEKATPSGLYVVLVQVVELLPALAKLFDVSSDPLWRNSRGRTWHLKNRRWMFCRIMLRVKNSNKDNADECRSVWLHLLWRIWDLGPGH
ncbi:hypothetical protein MKW92_049869, partial [Papaver armeniacum]